MRNHRNTQEISLTAASVTAAVTPERAMQSVQDAFSDIVAVKDKLEISLHEEKIENERVRELLNAKDNQLQEAQRISKALYKTCQTKDAEKHTLKAENDVLKATNARLTNAQKMEKKEMVKKDKKIKAFRRTIKTLTLMLARKSGQEYRLSEY